MVIRRKANNRVKEPQFIKHQCSTVPGFESNKKASDHFKVVLKFKLAIF